MAELLTQCLPDTSLDGALMLDMGRLVEEADHENLLALGENMEPIDFATKVGELGDADQQVLLDLLQARP